MGAFYPNIVKQNQQEGTLKPSELSMCQTILKQTKLFVIRRMFALQGSILLAMKMQLLFPLPQHGKVQVELLNRFEGFTWTVKSSRLDLGE